MIFFIFIRYSIISHLLTHTCIPMTLNLSNFLELFVFGLELLVFLCEKIKVVHFTKPFLSLLDLIFSFALFVLMPELVHNSHNLQ